VNIIYEDNHLLVVEKPYGVPSQEDSTGDDDMLSLCRAYIKKKYDKPGDVFLGLVHRLDRPTRGVMVFAKTSKAASRLSEQIRRGEFKKTYLAVLTREPPRKKGSLTGYLVKDETRHVARTAEKNEPGAKKASLDYEVLGARDGLCLVRVWLNTGRFHQIRAQFAGIGCAVYGDMKYGNGEKAKLALFAEGISLIHPTKREAMLFRLTPAHHPFDKFEEIKQAGAAPEGEGEYEKDK
jgi:23S rRNA pseudouridine1911/1915/1917 synthase